MPNLLVACRWERGGNHLRNWREGVYVPLGLQENRKEPEGNRSGEQNPDRQRNYEEDSEKPETSLNAAKQCEYEVSEEDSEEVTSHSF
ncbi:MAG: hypothetical protein IAE94_01855 [Chthoniobacterales bacterium]|nr:hypothetical protein [Chthoniobacterales bacterium]